MKAKVALLLVVGFVLVIAGALLKIGHWPGAAALLLVGLGCALAGAVAFLIKLLTQPTIKKFLND